MYRISLRDCLRLQLVGREAVCVDGTILYYYFVLKNNDFSLKMTVVYCRYATNMSFLLKMTILY